jgi:hypothetical protein
LCLVLGSTGHGAGVRAHRWDRLPPNGLNVADYEAVILNFAAFEDEDLAEGFQVELLPTVRSMTRLAFSPGAEVIAIGDPSTMIGSWPEKPLTRAIDPRARCDYWLPFEVEVEEDSGTQYRVEDEEWTSYFENVMGWQWIATGECPSRYYDSNEYLQGVTNKAHQLFSALEPVAITPYNKSIAVRVHLRAIRYGQFLESYSGVAEGDPRSAELVLESRSIVWLPAPDRVGVEEAIDMILQERYAIAPKARAPEWVQAYSLPAERPIASEIESLEQERTEVQQRIREAQGRAAEAALPRGLLYESGEDELEPIVRNTLRQLGARVEDPVAKGVEDGKLFHNERQAVLEIKGREGPIKLVDVRQVVQWADEAKANDGIEYKRVIIANAYCDKPLEERGEVLAPNAARYAHSSGVSVVTTAQLFEALRQQQDGALDETRLWKAVFEAVGVADLDTPTPQA